MPAPKDVELVDEVSHAVTGLRGVLACTALSERIVAAIREAEAETADWGGVPVRNLGMPVALSRRNVLALLKDTSFRAPPAPTLYMVEDGGAAPGETLVLDGKPYHIIGEEVLPGRTAPDGAILMGEAFFLHRDRRREPARSVFFLLPPVAFPELETRRWASLLAGVTSASPSAAADRLIRRHLGFAQESRLATLILGFDTAASFGRANRSPSETPGG
jgi:hypothetical protein